MDKNKALKLVVACIICLGVIIGLVFLGQKIAS